MNLGIIGLGYWGPNIVRNAVMNRTFERIVCCDKDEQQILKIKNMFPSVEITTDYKKIVSDPDIKAVAVITPVQHHYEIAKEALLNGKHILVEKPFMATVEQAEDILKIAKERQLITMVDHTFIYTPAVKKIKELYTKGEIGEIYFWDSVRVNLGLFQRDVNVIWDLAPHDFSIMNYVLARKPVFLKAMGSDHVGNGLEDIAYVHIHFDDNIIAHFHLNWLSPVKIRKTLIAGTKKMIVYDDLENSEKIKVYDKGIDLKSKEDEWQKLVNYRTGDINSPVLDNTEALKAMLQEFIDSIVQHRKPITAGENGLMVVKLLTASQKSIKNKGEVVYIN